METMCERCERLDVQALKNRTNKLVLLVDKVARAVEIKEPDWEKRLEAVKEWADNEIALQMMPKRRRRDEEGNNA